MDKIRAIITGATGMVGEGVLHTCLQDAGVEAVLVINRKSCGVSHPKLKEILHADFFNIAPIAAQLKGYNACFFCLGVSSVGMKEEEYRRKTYVLTLHVAEILVKESPDLCFCYISGAGTDSTEKGRSMWARVKGKTENDLMKLPFKKVLAFRPGFIKPIKGLKNIQKIYRYINWIFPIGRALAPGAFCRLTELADAMIYSVNSRDDRKAIEGKEIIVLSQKKNA